MTNLESGDKLLKEAGVYMREMEANVKVGEWNISIRKAQEVVELCLKGLLKIMEIEYPKVHDLGRFFVKVLMQKGIELSREDQDKIRVISANLAEKRAPAFYFEKEYTKEEAKEAMEDSLWIFQKSTILKEVLEGKRR